MARKQNRTLIPGQYELLGNAALPITDQASVWVVFLFTECPIVFAFSDLEECMRNRGYYFAPVRNPLPRPLVGDLETLPDWLEEFLSGADQWAGHTVKVLPIHHLDADGSSSEGVAQLVVRLLAGDPR